jgi:hypothetical protein
MNEEFKKILNKVDTCEVSVPAGLADSIILKIDNNAKQQAKLKTLGLGFVSVLSIITSVPIISQIITSFTQSGFYNYLSIIFSDGDVAIVYWKEILLTLAESLPVIAIISLLIVLAIFTWSVLKTASIVRNGLATA